MLFSRGRRLAGVTNSGISTQCTRASLRSTPGGVMGGGVTLPGARYGPCGAIALHRALAQKKASARAAWRLLCRQIQPWQPQRQTSGPGDARHTFRWTGLRCATSMKAPSAFPTPLGLDFPSKRACRPEALWPPRKHGFEKARFSAHRSAIGRQHTLYHVHNEPPHAPDVRVEARRSIRSEPV